MITNPVTARFHETPVVFRPAPALPAEPAPDGARNSHSDISALPNARLGPRPALRRSFELTDTPRVSQATLDQWKEQAGNTHNQAVLAIALREAWDELAKHPGADVATLLERKQFSVHSQSTFARDNQLQPDEQMSVAWYLREHSQYVPQDREQLSNFIELAANRLPHPPASGDNWGGLAPLDSAQRTKLNDLATAEMARSSPGNGMFKAFHDKQGAAVQGMSGAQVLELMIESPEIQALGHTLKSALPDVTTAVDAAELAVAAMILELDPQAGSKRGRVAGYELYQAANQGVKPSVVVERLTQHLIGQGKVPAQMAPAAARLLLAGAGPEFLVADVPDNLVVGSATWAKLQAVVEADEFWAPGVATVTGFETFMKRSDLDPVSVNEAFIQGEAQSHALIEWGVANDRIIRKDDDAYTPSDINRVREAFNAELTALKKAHGQLSATMPTRKGLALEELQRVYGSADSFDARTISIANIDASESENHSLLDIYMAGKMDRIPQGDRHDFQLGNRYLRVTPLPDINQRFNSQFDDYFRDLKEGVATVLKHQLSQLSLEDRQTIGGGKVEFFSLRKASVEQAEEQESEVEAQAAKARYGLLMRVETKIDKYDNNRAPNQTRYVYYEVFPLQGVIRRRDDLPRYLPNPPPRVADPDNYEKRQAKGVSVRVDYEAYAGGTPAQRNKVSHGLLAEPVKGLRLPEVIYVPTDSGVVHANPRFNSIADGVAGYLLHDREGMKAGAKGVTEVEKEEAGIKAGHDFVTGMIPFKNAIENAVNGNTGAAIGNFAMDIFGFLGPAAKGGAAVAGQVRRGLGKLASRAFHGAGAVDNVLFKGHAVSKSQLTGLMPNSQGVYTAADGRTYIRTVNASGEAAAFQVREVVSNQGAIQARLINPKTNRQTEFLLQRNGPDRWSSLGLKGGGLNPPSLNRSTTKRPLGQDSASNTSGGQPAVKRPRVPESFPGEKADLDPPVKGENVFYHYSGHWKHSAITSRRTLEPSSSGLTGQRLPGKQGRHYFTDLAPGDKSVREISETIFGRRRFGNVGDKMTHYYEINTSGLKLIKSADKPHIYYVDTAFSIPLKYRDSNGDLVDRVITHGTVPA